MRARRALVAVGSTVIIATGCVADDDSTETLPPLVSPSVAATGDDTSVTVEQDETFATPLTVEPSVLAAASSSTLEPRPVGDWDGARFDVGRITGTTEVGEYPAILFDRYSYEDPQLGAVDAAGFSEEPVLYWWVERPLFNISTTVRRFVLAPDVELLVLDEDGENRACSAPQPDPLPRPTWNRVERRFLQAQGATQAFASLSYSADGLVDRIRFTRGC